MRLLLPSGNKRVTGSIRLGSSGKLSLFCGVRSASDPLVPDLVGWRGEGVTVRAHHRLLALLAVGGLALAACGEAPEEDGNGDTGEASYSACMVTDIGGIDDRSFNASAWEGL